MTEKNILETFLENKTTHEFPCKENNDFILTDQTKQLLSLEKFYKNPLSIKEVREFDDLRGFVEYVNNYKEGNTVCFASRDKITVIFDYHQKDNPHWGAHQITYKIKRSNRWAIWEKAHNSWMAQKQFAEFLDTGLNEIISPSQADILTMVKNFRATVNYEVNSQEGAGGTDFTFKKTTKGGAINQATISIPEYLTIALQPFDNLAVINPALPEDKKIPAYNLRAKINWKMDVLNSSSEEELLSFKIQILNFEDAVDETLEAIRIAIKDLTAVTTYIG